MAARPRPRPRRRAVLALAALAIVAALSGLASMLPSAPGTAPAGAAVVPHHGFRATVMGWSSWYGSYHLGALGPAWCIDHGVRPPDEAFGYVPGGVAGVDADTQAAMAWAVARHGDDDPVRAAALLLVLHDLMGATYPFGRLDVDALGPGDLDGFGGHEAEIIARGRAIKADALAHRHLRGPLRLTVEAAAVRDGEPGTATVALTDAAGLPVADWPVDVSAEGAALDGPSRVVTGADGRATVGFRAAVGANRFRAAASAPDPVLDSWSPTTVAAQRIARPRHAQLRAEAAFDVAPPGRVRVDKRGDAVPYVPVAGARFELREGGSTGRAVATLVAGGDGQSDAVEVAPGDYAVVEVEPPPGYHVADPVPVRVEPDGDHVVVVHDLVERAQLAIHKVDAETGAPLAGAQLTLDHDADADGVPEGRAATVVTTEEPTVVPDLLPGDYLLTEVVAPDGYQRLDRPIPISLQPGQPGVVRLPNVPRATVGFEKHPVGGPVAPGVDLGGARFVVTSDPDDHRVSASPGAPPTTSPDAADPHEGGGEDRRATDRQEPAEIGSCTTDDRGRCTLAADALVSGRRYCWREVVAPAGFGLAEPGCFTAGEPGSIVTVAVAEPVLAPPPSDAPPRIAAPPVATPPADRSTGVALDLPLPRTGRSIAAWALLAVLLVAGGLGLVAGTARVRSRDGSRARGRRPDTGAGHR